MSKCTRRCERRKSDSVQIRRPDDHARVMLNVGLAFLESPTTADEGMGDKRKMNIIFNGGRGAYG